jgi:O-methyltransferase
LTDVPDAIQRLNMRSVRKWTTLALTRARLLETSKQRGQREMIVDAFNYTAFSQVAGDYLEFGVYRGDSFINAWDSARVSGRHDVRFYAFDSFRGLPDPETSASDADGEFVKGQFSAERSLFEQNLRRAGVDLGRVTVVEGFYESTLPGTSPADIGLHAASIVWVDCDLYVSTMCALDFVTDLLQDGSVLAFDDWHCFRSRPDMGEQKACAEWLSRNPQITLSHYHDFHWAGRSFIAHVDAGPG